MFSTLVPLLFLALLAAAVATLVVEAWRGDVVESEHLIHGAVCGTDGEVLASWGDPFRVTYPRSSLKPLQAMAMVGLGAADAFGLSEREIAIACASHSGEPFHLEAARSLLSKVGLNEGSLRCGPHRPAYGPEADALVRSGCEALPIHNNCSGKHSGMLALARHLGAPLETYLDIAHPVQQEIIAHLSRLTGVPRESIRAGADGCGAPTFALPIAGAATAFARLAAADTGTPEGDAAARRITAAMMAHPELIAGTGRFDTALMRALTGSLFCKGGAEGFFCIGVPERKIGVALKVADGTGRAREPAAVYILQELGVLPEPVPAALAAFANPPVTNTARQVAGHIHVAGKRG
ncbi:MAG: asparaginase [Armatimonadetes bacterium]|nr:asparaginase [Armatimonadota bacterium]